MNARRLTALLVICLGCAWGANAQAPVQRTLDEFGPVDSVEAAGVTLQTAIQTLLGEGGGVLVIPPDVTQDLEIENLQQGERATRNEGPAVSIIDYRGGFTEFLVAPIGRHQSGNWTGFRVERVLNLGEGSLPHWGVQSAQAIDNFIVSGSSSYMHVLDDPVEPGQDVRCIAS